MRGWARASSRNSSSVIEAETSSWARSLPRTWTTAVMVSSATSSGSATGKGSWASDWSCPSRCHSSSAMCGASGATISTSGSTAALGTTLRAVRTVLYSVSRAMAVLNDRFS